MKLNIEKLIPTEKMNVKRKNEFPIPKKQL